MSFSLYISVLAVSDTMTLAIGKFFKDISEDMSPFAWPLIHMFWIHFVMVFLVSRPRQMYFSSHNSSHG